MGRSGLKSSRATAPGVHTIAFPSISTGAFGFPIEKASRIALAEIKKFLERNPTLETVTIICFDRRTLDCYATARSEVL